MESDPNKSETLGTLSEEETKSRVSLADRIGAKFDQNIRRAEENPDAPQVDMSSVVKNLFAIIESQHREEMTKFIPPQAKDAPHDYVVDQDHHLGAVSRSPTSGQYKFTKAKNFTTTFKDGRVLQGIHGISMHSTDPNHHGPKCYNCGKIHDLRRCGRCKKIWYCDKECQSFDWSRHKPECKPISSQ
jgi:hypothetical protein